jgi:nucleolar MIF4G domain-containing protein 1
MHNTAKLPRQLLDELGVSGNSYDSSQKKGRGLTKRKELRKASRVQKSSSKDQKSKAYSVIQTSNGVLQSRIPIAPVQPKAPKSILKVSKTQPAKPRNRVRDCSPSPSPPPQLSKDTRSKFAEDDAEIKALESALGVKRTDKLPKYFEDDGLDSLLDDIDWAVDLNDERRGKRKRTEEDEWLERKRQKAQRAKDIASGFGDSDALLEEVDSGDSQFEAISQDGGESGNTDTDGFDGFDTSSDESSQRLPKSAIRRTRENPYVAPVVRSDVTEPKKYVPPSLRNEDLTGLEDLSKLRRQTQGLLNRLSEANVISILGDIEKLYQDNARQHVTTTLLDLLIGLLSDPTHLQDTFIILHAGFLAALYKVIGTNFGAQAIQRIDEEFNQNYQACTIEEGTGKKLTNLMSLLSELYNFQVIGSKLIYDYIRLCLGDLSETNIELLLKIIRSAGQQLRQDDPSSLKDIVIQIHKAIVKAGEENLSVRAKFMVETINNLKNNRMKTGAAASTITSEHTIRMKKTLGSLSTRALKATEPLRIGMKDLRDKDKVGKWWLVRATYKDDLPDENTVNPLLQANQHSTRGEQHAESNNADLVQIAKEQRMNTDVRRSIFVSIMSSTDYNDAYVRLMKLRLKRTQEFEIAKVIVHCAGAEKVYNPFYTFLSRRVCSDKKLKMSFQFALWDLFKQMGGEDDELDEEEAEEGNKMLGLRSLVNLAKMYGILIAERGLSLDVLKNLDFGFLQQRTRIFVEVLLIAAILHSQHGYEGHTNEKALLDIFLEAKQISEMAGGIRYFLKTVVRRTDIAGSKSEKETIKWACKIVCDALNVIATQTVADNE